MRIGVFGGTFDPIHYGHLRLAEEARESFCLDMILFIPASVPPHKTHKKVSHIEHRLEMVRRAVAENPAFQVSDLECSRPGVSYSVETLRLMQQMQGPEVEMFFLAGLDAFLNIHTWKAFPELFEMSNWIVLGRSGFRPSGKRALPAKLRSIFRYDSKERAWVHPSGHRVFFRGFRSLDVSGTEIRALLRSGRSIRYLVPEEVAGYIALHRLYAVEAGAKTKEPGHGP